jgi:spectinomycin phosphotransferase
LDEEQLARHITMGWQIDTDELAFIPAGEDSYAWAYQVRERSNRFFLKVWLGPVQPASVMVPRYLRTRGLNAVVAPIPTADGRPWHEFDEYRLLLYPFIPGQSAARRGLSDAQWVEYGSFLAALHAVDLPTELATTLPAETFRPARIAKLHAVTERIRRGGFVDAPQREVARIWRERGEQIAAIARRSEELAALAKAQQQPHVLCHADIHRANLIVANQRKIHVVDWDRPGTGRSAHHENAT